MQGERNTLEIKFKDLIEAMHHIIGYKILIYGNIFQKNLLNMEKFTTILSIVKPASSEKSKNILKDPIFNS